MNKRIIVVGLVVLTVAIVFFAGWIFPVCIQTNGSLMIVLGISTSLLTVATNLAAGDYLLSGRERRLLAAGTVVLLAVLLTAAWFLVNSESEQVMIFTLAGGCTALACLALCFLLAAYDVWRTGGRGPERHFVLPILLSALCFMVFFVWLFS